MATKKRVEKKSKTKKDISQKKTSTIVKSAKNKKPNKTISSPKNKKQKTSSLHKTQTLSRIDIRESYISLLLGIIVVVVCIIFFFTFFNVKHMVLPAFEHKTSQSILTGINQKNLKTQQITNPTNKIFGNTYTVHEGDDLYDIAQRAYGNGDKWVDLANVNNIAEPDILNAGQVIKIPR